MRSDFFSRQLGVLFTLGLFAGTALGQCPGAEPPSDFCTGSRVMSGAPGVQVVQMNVSTATAFGESICGVPVGHSVWFSIVPSASGLLTFTTCTPFTTYDTVAEVYSGGDSGCEFMNLELCNDDTPSGACSNGCSAYGSTLQVYATAGQVYRFRVGSYNNNSAGCTLCLGVMVTLCNGEATPPTATIFSPATLSCLCPGVHDVIGAVSDEGSGVASYTLDYARVAGGPWTLISQGLGNVTGILGQWNVTGLGDEDYYLRLSARDGCGNVTATLATCRINPGVDSFQLRSPVNGSVLGGVVVADGTAYDWCPPGSVNAQWAPVGGSFSSFTTVNPPWIINDPIGSWNTRAGVPDGSYVVRLNALTSCQTPVFATANVAIDNTPPIATISAPLNCSHPEAGILQVRGTVSDAHLASWVLQYTGGASHVWTTIASGSSPILNGVLGTWDTRAVTRCAYSLRLVATDSAVLDNNGALHNQTEFEVSIDLGPSCTQDYNGDGVVNSQDFFDFLNIFFEGCP